MTFPFFDGFRATGRVAQARSNLARAQRDDRVAQVNLLWAMGVAGE